MALASGKRRSGPVTFRIFWENAIRFSICALKGTAPFEFGGLIAERLAAEGAPVVFVTVALDGKIDAGMAGDWEGRLNQYFFWDAWGKGLLPPDEKRDQWLKDDISWKTDKTVNRRESRYRGLIDGATYAGDLWTSVAYRYLCSVWSHLKYEKFWDSAQESSRPRSGQHVTARTLQP